jgi:hypothetical protein
MKNATKVTVATFGILAGLAGIEHGIGEILQGNRAAAGIVIKSWPDTPAMRIVSGEPAMTIVPNLRITGILAISVSLAFIAWATLFVQRPHGGVILLLLSLVLLLVGGGFGPPLLGLILGIAATRINTPLTWGRASCACRATHSQRSVAMVSWDRVDRLAARYARLDLARLLHWVRRAHAVHVDLLRVCAATDDDHHGICLRPAARDRSTAASCDEQLAEGRDHPMP